MLTDEQRTVLRLTFDPLMPLPKKFALDFFEQLFALDPGLEQSFRADLDQQAMQFAVALSGGIVHLIDEGLVSEAVRQMGVRLRGHGLLERDYETFNRALLSMFEQRLGSDLTAAGREAWNEAWDLLSTAMQKAATAASTATTASSATAPAG